MTTKLLSSLRDLACATSSRPQSFALGVPQRVLGDRGRETLVEVLDLDLRARHRQLGGQVTVDDAAPHRVAVPGGRRVAADVPPRSDRLLAEHDRGRVVERDTSELLAGALLQ